MKLSRLTNKEIIWLVIKIHMELNIAWTRLYCWTNKPPTSLQTTCWSASSQLQLLAMHKYNLGQLVNIFISPLITNLYNSGGGKTNCNKMCTNSGCRCSFIVKWRFARCQGSYRAAWYVIDHVQIQIDAQKLWWQKCLSSKTLFALWL